MNSGAEALPCGLTYDRVAGRSRALLGDLVASALRPDYDHEAVPTALHSPRGSSR